VTYPFLRKLLFRLPAEQSHDLALSAIKKAPVSLLRRMAKEGNKLTITDQPRTVMGIEFPNAVGLAAGLDKNADYFSALSQFGFGFVEVGTQIR